MLHDLCSGFLQYVTTPVVKFSLRDNVVLQYRVVQTSSIRTTHWFYKGQCIDCYFRDRYQLDLSNTRLTIINASEKDIGQYEVRVTELDFHGANNATCGALALDLLQQYAFYAPVVFYVTMNGILCIKCSIMYKSATWCTAIFCPHRRQHCHATDQAAGVPLWKD